MLEQGRNPDEEEPSTPLKEDFYIPPASAEALSGQVPAPNVKRFNRKMLAVLSIIVVIVVTLAFVVGLRELKQPAPAPETATGKTPLPNPSVSALPSNYSDQVPELGLPRSGDLGAPTLPVAGAPNGSTPGHQPSAFEQYEEQLRLEHLRAADRARSSGVAFANAGGNETLTNAASGGAGELSGMQERLLGLAQGAGRTPSGMSAEREDPNHQDDKVAFAERQRDSEFFLRTSLKLPRSPYTLFAGTIIPCVMTQGIDSDLPGQIGCMISQNVYDTVTGTHLLLPQGTKAIGTYDSHVGYGQERILVVWTRLLRPDGSTLALEGMPGIDLSGYAGLSGHLNNHYARLLSGVVLGSLLGASAQIAVGTNGQNPSFSQLAVQGAGQNINEAGQQITRRNLNIQPTIEVRPGARLNIFATRDLILPPWMESFPTHMEASE